MVCSQSVSQNHWTNLVFRSSSWTGFQNRGDRPAVPPLAAPPLGCISDNDEKLTLTKLTKPILACRGYALRSQRGINCMSG